MTQNFDANSTNVTEVRTNERTNEHTNGRTDKRKGENYIPVGINAGGITNGIANSEDCDLTAPLMFGALQAIAVFAEL